MPAVLRDADAVPARHPRIAVGHVRRALLVHRRHEADARRRKQVERVHEGRADDAEDVLHALGDQGFHKRFAGVMCCLLLMSISWRAGAGRVDSGLHIGRATPILHPKRRHSHPASFHFPQNPSRGGPPQARSSFLKDERRILRRARAHPAGTGRAIRTPGVLGRLTEGLRPAQAVRAAHPVAAGRRRHAARARQQELRQRPRLSRWRATP